MSFRAKIFLIFLITVLVNKRELYTDRRIEVVQEITIILKNLCLILVLCQLVGDILKDNGLGK